MISSCFINATDLTHWSDRRDAQSILPQLIRKLVYATVKSVHRSGFPAGEGVQLGGWDGIVEVEHGNAFVPDGMSAWELGTGKKIKGKADDDYEKRTNNPQGVTLSETSYVFVTTRRWSGKDQWITDREKEGKWREVRVYDAGSLEEWLETASAVHVWISILLGKHPERVKDADTYWADWSNSTTPNTSTDLVLSGRDTAVESIHTWLKNPTTPLVLRGESRIESIAVFLAVLQKLPLPIRYEMFSRCVVVDDSTSWNQLTSSEEHLVLVQNFDSWEAIGRAKQKEHAVVVVLGRSDTAPPNAVEITRLSSEESVKALIAMGVTKEKSNEFVTLSRRSLTCLRRKIAVIPGLIQPEWAKPENACSIISALLVGQWSNQRDGDKEAIAKLADNTYNKVSTIFTRWSNEDDPPLRCVGNSWYLSSVEDAWSLLERYLSREDLERFEQIVLNVLGTANPSYDLPNDQRWMAGILGKQPVYSELLQSGIANSLAIMGARGKSITSTGGLSINDYVNRCVRKLLDTNDWKLWSSLPLALIAEAAPEEFLSAVTCNLEGDDPPLLSLFGETDDHYFSSSPHVKLLWALETLAWSVDHFSQAILALAKLAHIDPGGKLTNRPLNSLRSIFLFWLPQTSASLDSRFRSLDNLRKRFPQISWQLMRSLLPKNHSSQSPTSKPQWRDWSSERDDRVTTVEYVNGIGELVTRMLHDVGKDGERWSDLIKSITSLPYEQNKVIINTLRNLNINELQSGDLAVIWNALRALISDHRSYPDAKWTLSKTEIDNLEDSYNRFKPTEPVDRYKYLFSHHPKLLEGREDDIEVHQETVSTLRTRAVEILYKDAGLKHISKLVENANIPDAIGFILTKCVKSDEISDVIYRENLCHESEHRRRFISGYIHGRSSVDGMEWVKRKFSTYIQSLTVNMRGEFCTSLPFQESTWNFVKELDTDTSNKYWSTVTPHYAEPSETEQAVHNLLEHGRPNIAVRLLSLREKSEIVPVSLVADTLELFLQSPENEVSQHNESAHDISDLLKVVVNSTEIDRHRAVKLEWAFLHVLGNHTYQPVVLHNELAMNPKLFSDVIGFVFRSEDEEQRDLSDEESYRSTNGNELLESWRTIPGTLDDGSLDAETLQEWLTEARKFLQTDKRLAIGDIRIGQLLSNSPTGEDGAWPHQCIRDIIEELESDDLEEGILAGQLNSEGGTWRKQNEGGTRERKRAETFENFANITSDRWSRTTAMLRRIRDYYYTRAHDEDKRQEINNDLSR